MSLLKYLIFDPSLEQLEELEAQRQAEEPLARMLHARNKAYIEKNEAQKMKRVADAALKAEQDGCVEPTDARAKHDISLAKTALRKAEAAEEEVLTLRKDVTGYCWSTPALAHKARRLSVESIPTRFRPTRRTDWVSGTSGACRDWACRDWAGGWCCTVHGATMRGQCRRGYGTMVLWKQLSMHAVGTPKTNRAILRATVWMEHANQTAYASGRI